LAERGGHVWKKFTKHWGRGRRLGMGGTVSREETPFKNQMQRKRGTLKGPRKGKNMMLDQKKG